MLTCQPVPLTGRKQIALIPENQLFELSFEQYQQILDSSKVVFGTDQAMLVKDVGNDIRKAIEGFLKNEPDMLKRYRWEFNLIADSSINAFALPGGKVAVYTGMIPIAKNRTGMAFIIGHELAHAVAEHGNERLSQLLLADLGAVALQEALRTQPQRTRQLALAAFGLGAQVGILLPYSRLQETEADRLGLIFMAMAGYDPNEAVDMWQRMIDARFGPQIPEFLSTHPADDTRMQNLKNMLPEALKYYKQ